MVRLTLKQRILLVLCLIVAILLAILGGIVYPVAKKIYHLQNEIDKIEAELEKRYENSQKLQRTVRELDTVKKDVDELSKTIIKAGGELGLITELEKLAEANRVSQNLNVALKEIPKEERRAGLTHYYFLTFSNTGEFANLARYLSELEKMPVYFITDNIRWEKSKSDKIVKSTLTLNFNSMVYVEPASVKK